MDQAQVFTVSGIPTLSAGAPDMESHELVHRARAGDLRAFEALVRETQGAITSVVARIIDGQDDVDDVVQDVYVQAFQHLSAFRGESQFSTWLHRIAVNTSLKRLKQIRRKGSLSLDDPENGLADHLHGAPELDPRTVVMQKERDEAVRRAVSTLPEKHRVVVVLRYFNDYSCEEIANVLGCSVGTVWSRLHYACKQLKNTLGWVLE